MIQLVYESVVVDREFQTVKLRGVEASAKFGKHCIWVPELGVKLIWSYWGRIESYRDWDKGRNKEAILKGTFNEGVVGFDSESLKSIADEWKIMQLLSYKKMAPPVGKLFYIRKVVSSWPTGTVNCDPIGMYGYEVQDATTLPEGKWSFDKMMELFTEQKVRATNGAKGDFKKADNVVNGYLVDVRRTIWDMIGIPTAPLLQDLEYKDSPDRIKQMVQEKGQFPYGERKKNYLGYWLGEEYVEGSRSAAHRLDRFGANLAGKSVLDLGCCIGSVAMEAYCRGARLVAGVDSIPMYIDCAIDIARFNGYHINFLVADVTSIEGMCSWSEKYFGKDGPDYVFALSLYKHIEGKLFDLLEKLKWKVCFLESNNAPQGIETPHVIEMMKRIRSMGVISTYMGQTEDRSPRAIWKLTRLIDGE